MSKKIVDLNGLEKLSQNLHRLSKNMVDEEQSRATAEEQILQAEIKETKEMLGGRSIKYITQAEYDQLSDTEKNSATVTYFITDAEDHSHEHENMDFLNNLGPVNITVGNKTHTHDGTQNLEFTLNDIGAAPSGHNHDNKYYTETEIDGMLEDINDTITSKETALQTAINRKADNDHAHDERYYTQNDIDTKLETVDGTIASNVATLQAAINGKAPASHSHDDKYYTEGEVDSFLDDINEAVETLETNLTSKINGKADNDHAHDERYYQKSEIDTEVEELEKSVTDLDSALRELIASQDTATLNSAKSYTDTAVTNLVDSAPDAMNTLKELATAIKTHNDEYTAYVSTVANNIATAKAEAIAEAAAKDAALKTQLQAEIDADVKVEKERAMDVEAELQAAINGKAAEGHNHNDTYYTESEINTKISALQAEIDADVKVEKERAEAIEKALQEALNGKAAGGHNHDDRYYTETEINTKINDINTTINTKEATLQAAINGKANSSHGTHVPTPQTADNTKFLRNDNTWQAVTPENIGAAPKTHDHTGVYLPLTGGQMKGNITYQLDNGSNARARGDVYVNHDGSTFGRIGGYALNGIGSHFYIGFGDTPWETSNSFAVSPTSLTYMDNEIYHEGNKPTLDELGAADSSTVSSLQAKVDTLQSLLDDIQALVGADPDIVDVAVTGGKAILTTDKYQRLNGLIEGTQIVFPTVAKFTELHVYFEANSNLNIVLPECKWRLDPNIETAHTFEMIVVYNKKDWLVNIISYSGDEANI